MVGLLGLEPGCKGTGGGGAPAGNVSLRSKTAMVSPGGGMVALDDGTQVEVPPGALAAATMITVSRPEAAAFGAGGVLASVLLQPEGLTFATPVRVTIPYDAMGVPAQDLVVAHASTANPQREVGGERSIMEVVTDATATAKGFEAPLGHFSALHVLYYPRLFITPEIPGRYLQSGDLLYALTNAENHKDAIATPMHVGLFVKNAQSDGVIESTLPTAGCPAQNGVSEGVYEGDCGFRSLRGQHVFIGARRPNRTVTVAQGEAAVRTAHRWLGTTYGIVGFPTKVDGVGLSCVQLAEDAWEGAGVNICYTPDQLLTPHNQYGNTVPVDSITVDVADGEVRIPIVVAARTSTVFYTAIGGGRLDGTVTMVVDDPEVLAQGRARLEDPRQPPGASGKYGPQAIKDLVFRPVKEDAGFSYRFEVEAAVPSLGYDRVVTNFLRISVADEADGGAPADAAKPDDSCNQGFPWKGTMMATVGPKAYSYPSEVRTEANRWSLDTPTVPPGYLFLGSGNTGPLRPGTATYKFEMPMDPNAPQIGASWNCPEVSASLSTSPVRGGQVTVTLSADCENIMIMVMGLSPYPTDTYKVNCDYLGMFTGRRVRF